MRLLILLREALATTWANKVPSALVTFLVTVMVAATLATVGRTAAVEEQLEARMDAAGSRLLTVRDVRSNALLGASIIDQTSAMSFSERAVGTLPAIDVAPGPVGPGEALVSASAQGALGMTRPFGWVAEATTSGGAELAVVGSFVPREPFGYYDAGLIYHAGDAPPAHSRWSSPTLATLPPPNRQSSVSSRPRIWQTSTPPPPSAGFSKTPSVDNSGSVRFCQSGRLISAV